MRNEVFDEISIAQKENSQKNTLLKMTLIAKESKDFDMFFYRLKQELGWVSIEEILDIVSGSDLCEFYEKMRGV
jgi:hypothetical protein